MILQLTLLHTLEALCQQGELLAKHHAVILEALLPALAATVAAPSESGDTRFLCLKLLCDSTLQLLAEADPARVREVAAGTGKIRVPGIVCCVLDSLYVAEL